jgi:hypothetical protein
LSKLEIVLSYVGWWPTVKATYNRTISPSFMAYILERIKGTAENKPSLEVFN